MGAVSNLKPTESLESHLDFLFRNETGYVYAPNKALDLQGKSDPKGTFSKRFFLWPKQKKDLIEYVEEHRKYSDVYLSPALFVRPFENDSQSVESVKGSFTFWVDFDGSVPNETDLREANTPLPSWRNCSSTEGHEHWYWSSPTFITNIADIQDTNKALAYALNGDKGGWYAHKVLRPVSGINHKRNEEEVTIASRMERHYPLSAFAEIPIPTIHFTESEYNPHKVPPAIEVLCNYEIKVPDFVDLIKKNEITKDRSGALAKLAMYCVEHGMTSHEIMSLLKWKDKQWGKFANRPNPEKEYVNLVNYAFSKTQQKLNSIPLEEDENFKVLGYMDVINHVDTTKYLIEGLLPEDGIMVIAGRSGSQKTTLAIDMVRKFVLGKHLFNWRTTIEEQMRVMLFSMEMPFNQLKEFLAPAVAELDLEDQKLLNANFRINDDPIKFYEKGPKHIEMIQNFVNAVSRFKPHIVIIDSATVAIAKGDQNPVDVQASLDLLKAIIKKLHFSVIIIAHTRKDPPKSGYRQKDLDDLFGAQNLAAVASAVIGVQKEQNKEGKYTGLIDISYLKTRFMGDSEMFQIAFRPEDFSFYRPALAPEYSPTIAENEPPVDKKDNDGGSFIPI